MAKAAEVGGLAFALQRGCDALCVDASLLPPGDDGGAEDLDAAAASRAAALLDALHIAKAQRLERADGPADASAARAPLVDGVELRGAVVTSVEAGGTADRVALDFTTLFRDDEGCLLGSSAKLLVLVHAETVASGFVPPRPFRVNAGPVHSYVAMADGGTKYLSEVRAGDSVCVVSSVDGSARAAVVGRCKVEPRPTLRVAFEVGGEAGGEVEARGQIFLQQAETVRLASGSTAVPVTSVGPGEALVVRSTAVGTHVGKAIGARVDEL